MDGMIREGSRPINWSLLYTHLSHVKSVAENLLFLTGFMQGIPKVVRMISSASLDISSTFLKPLDIFLGTIKDTGSFVEMFEKVPPLLFGKIKRRESGCRYWGRRADAIAVAIEGLIMIPNRFHLLNLGRFAEAMGGLKILKDSSALVSIGCGYVAAGGKIRRNVAKLDRCKWRLRVLEKLESLIQKNSWTHPELQEIDRLKLLYQTGGKDLEKKTKDLHLRWQKETQLLERHRLEKEWAALREKAFRHKVWTQRCDPHDIGRLRDVVAHRIDNTKIRQIRARKRIELAKAERRHSVSISLLIVLGLVAQISLFSASPLLFLGQWIVSLSTGILGFGKIAATLRYKSVVRNSGAC